MTDDLYITTPIYYVNDKPHLGSASTTVLADVLARYRRLFGGGAYLVTGTDEHGQKNYDAAVKAGIQPQVFVDAASLEFREAWDQLDVEPDDFIRTTEPRHSKVVQALLEDLRRKGDIYLGKYQGWYCTPDERFWTEKDLVDRRCPDCGRAVELLNEDNYFFRMSKYQEWLVDYIQSHPGFIQPDNRRNEVLGFLGRPLGDLCISRPVARLNWGIPLPFDPGYVTYVWFDALWNYVTAAGYLDAPDQFAKRWSNAVHLIGKDILITHAVYWSTMLHAAGLPLPRHILAHGWWVFGGGKMSKSLGNVVSPLDLVDRYAADAVRFTIASEVKWARDTDFREDVFSNLYRQTLANDLGNLVHRVVNMVQRYCDGRIPDPKAPTTDDTRLRDRCLLVVDQVKARIEEFAIAEAIGLIIELVRETNGYVEHSAPWAEAKRGNDDRVSTILYHAAETLRIASVLLHPVMPESTVEIWRRLGWERPSSLGNSLHWGSLTPGSEVSSGPPLFPRLDG